MLGQSCYHLPLMPTEAEAGEWLIFLLCGLNGASPETCVHVRNLTTCDSGLIWGKGLCGCNEVQDREMRLSGGALNPMASVGIKETNQMGEAKAVLSEPLEPGGQHPCL